MLLFSAGGVAGAVETAPAAQPDPNAAPSTRPAAGPEKATRAAAAGARPVSGKNPTAAPLSRNAAPGGFQRVTSQKVQLKNKVTDADGDKSTLTFEVWTSDAAGNPLKKVSIADNQWGVIVSPYVASGTTVTADVPVGKLALNTNYVFHTSAFDGSLYETSWSPWAKFRIELPVDLTLPTPDYSAPDPTSLNTPPNYYQTKPLGSAGTPLSARSPKSAVEQCSEADADGRQVCFGKSTPVAKGKAPKSGAKAADVAAATAGVEWCNTDFESILATRFTECDVRSVPVYISMDGKIQATAHFMFLRMLQLDGQNSFTEHLTIEPAQQIPPAFREINFVGVEHLCQGSCTPHEPDHSAWRGKTWWVPGEMHSASLTTSYTWDASVAGKTYLYKPDVKIDANILPADGKIRPFMTGYQWSLDYDGGTEDLDQIRCDTTNAGPGTGCVFVNHAPTYIFNAKAYPQAAAHAWLIQKATPKHPGSMADQKPLYYMGDSAQNSRSRNRICPTGWAAANGDASALVDAADALNCDEFAFASSYNSGGMSSAEGGLNPALPPGGGTTPTGAACIGTYAKKHGSMVHLFSLNGTDPTFSEVCGRSAISGMHNQESMGNHFATFMRDMRIMDKDAYWLDTRMDDGGTCKYGIGGGQPVICKLAAE
ncbi:hypothetical protein QIS99_28645 [Streptomyces sp. B-S-A8]|uniref:Uncharacterized protein n=1 Tax=Streptomyces solicavernae TaxID=3043614 RepID=A0ABT6S126_9ACTN|nr:hypothetical protein [Streptomyces sp. B-S-A8]MDI3390129.1 hypothetical protein [Streptomyces sp. B-S-A8]